MVYVGFPCDFPHVYLGKLKVSMHYTFGNLEYPCGKPQVSTSIHDRGSRKPSVGCFFPRNHMETLSFPNETHVETCLEPRVSQ